ncbi:MAG TPA: orotidine 5'-phosphate decarboxylase, partial [Syntrophorhabdaceae bacterium]|nr:orotidine 5'-phosphate decarboxylase [Syntrophorhabdaceae bacterium]
IVTPGVRIGEKKDDQKRIITPKDAIEKGASYIVLGRTILEHPQPFVLLEGIYKDILDALSH